ncbi:MAG: hypothetical protein NT061_13640 [Spirochaetes bacterium]|nr:hypothetical protein [Spirochaetota bacterium]
MTPTTTVTTLKKRKDGTLVYAIPLWYRLVTGAMLALVAGGLLSSGEAPGILAWIIMALLALGLLYEERWAVPPESGELRHVAGILPFASRLSIPFGRIEGLSLTAFARGTIPGTEDERKEKERAYSLLDASISASPGLGAERPSFLKPGRKPYLNLVVMTIEGQEYLLDSLPAARAARLLKVGRVLAEACGVEFREMEKN